MQHVRSSSKLLSSEHVLPSVTILLVASESHVFQPPLTFLYFVNVAQTPTGGRLIPANLEDVPLKGIRSFPKGR